MAEWLGQGLFKALGPYLQDELGVEEVDDLRFLKPEHLATLRGMLKPVPLNKFDIKYAELVGAGGGRPPTAPIPEGVAEKPAGAAQPECEPEVAIREVHNAGVVAVDVAGALDWELTPIQPSKTADFSPALCIFGSMRFPVPLEARMLFAALQAAGVYLKIVDMRAGEDIDKEIYEWIEHCHAFLAFGTKNYGEDTGNSACTYNEVKFAQAKKKHIILLRMIPWEAEFEELQARVLFNRNMLTLEWQQGQPMPTSLVGEILKAMELPTSGVPGSPAALAHETTAARSAAEAANWSRAQAEAARAQAQAQAAQAQAAAAAAKAQAEAARARAEAEESMAMAAAEEEAARQLQEQLRAAAAAERQRKEQAQRQAQRAAALLSEVQSAGPARAVEILRQTADDAQIQAAGCRRLVELGNDDDANDSRIAAAGGIEAVLRAMGAHAGDARVQESGCGALMNLMYNSPERKAAVAAAGGLEAVLRAMGAHAGAAAVQQDGCAALMNLAGYSPERSAAVAAAGGLEAVLRSMGAHVGFAGVQEHGCAALRNLARNSPERKAAVAAAGGLEAVLRAMGAHAGAAGVQQDGCGALGNLAANSRANALAIEHAGGLTAIASARRAFPSDAGVTQMADGATEAIEASKRRRW